MGTFVVRREGIAVCAAILIGIACTKPVAQRAKTLAPGEPQVPATVITMQTSVQPANKTLTHQIVIADGRARSMNDTDAWRLIDLKQNNVTFVDDISRSFRTLSIESLVLKRHAADSDGLPDHTPRAQFISTGAKRVLQGVTASQALIRVGGYQRELWIADHPAIPPNLFAVLYASDQMNSPLAPMMKAVDDAMIGMHGVPLADHAELPYGKSKFVIDRTVVSIEKRNVPQSWLNISRDYKEVKEPAAGRPPASSRPPNQKTPATESRSSATGRKTP